MPEDNTSSYSSIERNPLQGVPVIKENCLTGTPSTGNQTGFATGVPEEYQSTPGRTLQSPSIVGLPSDQKEKARRASEIERLKRKVRRSGGFERIVWKQLLAQKRRESERIIPSALTHPVPIVSRGVLPDMNMPVVATNASLGGSAATGGSSVPVGEEITEAGFSPNIKQFLMIGVIGFIVYMAVK